MNRKLTYREALNEALAEEMKRDETVFLMGQSIAQRGGSFGVTRGLAEEFGTDRVLDIPIAEASATGMAIGAAIQGKRPVIEISFIDFTTLVLDQIINQAAKYSFITADAGSVPLVLRTQGGIGDGYGCQHSQSLEALFYHIPGLKVITPSTPADAKGLMKTAIRDSGPVVFIEHKRLYEQTGEIADDACIPFGAAALRMEGADCTIVSYSYMSTVAEQAAAILAEQDGITCDVLDLRTLVPMDREAIAKSVEKTGRLIVVSEAVQRGSVASDIAAWAGEQLWESLHSPVERVCGMVTPVPFNEALERLVTPDVEMIRRAVNRAYTRNR